MTDSDHDHFNLDAMSEDEKDELIEQLHIAYHEVLEDAEMFATLAAGLQSNMVLIGEGLRQGNSFGKRKKAIELAAVQMTVVATVALMKMGVDFEQIQTDSEFEDIISRIDDSEDSS